MFRRFLHYANHPMIMVISGGLLVVASGWELGEEIFLLGEGVQSEHGTLLFGITVTMKSLADLAEIDKGFSLMDEAEQKRSE